MSLSLLIYKMRIIIIKVTSWLWDKMGERRVSFSLEGFWKPRWLSPRWLASQTVGFYWANSRKKGARVTTGVSCVEFK